MNKILCGVISAAILTAANCGQPPTATAAPSAEITATAEKINAAVYLDYAAGIKVGAYRWIKSEDGTYYTLASVDNDGKPIKSAEKKINVGANNEERNLPPLNGKMPDMGKQSTVYRGVYMNSNVTNVENQTMLIYVPAAYMKTDKRGNVIGIDRKTKVGKYTADTAPIIYLNECGGWRSSSPRSVDTSFIKEGMVYVTAGARSRDAVDDNGLHTGKAPTPVIDLKSGIIALRANSAVIPGNKERIVSVGTSGGGQMSSILGASGDMSEYYPAMYEAGALGVAKKKDGNYTSKYPDHIYAAQLYCPIADIEG